MKNRVGGIKVDMKECGVRGENGDGYVEGKK